jgi:hypothetical protein
LAPFTKVFLGEGLELGSFPKAPGVVEFFGAGEKSLLVGRPRNLQRFISSHMGLGRPSRPGARPPLDLRPLAKSVRYCLTPSSFEQRLVYERVMAPLVPRTARRDLKDPFYLRIDLRERFPRVSVVAGASKSCYGPFRTRASADVALRELHRRFPLRPCDFVFEPDPELALGLGCIFAQTRTCSAPCLSRIHEQPYQTLAAEAAAFLQDPAKRPDLPWVPPFVADSHSTGLVVIPAEQALALYPVRHSVVLDEHAVVVERNALEQALARLSWDPPLQPRDDAPWFTEWLYARKKEGFFLFREAALHDTVVARLESPPSKR